MSSAGVLSGSGEGSKKGSNPKKRGSGNKKKEDRVLKMEEQYNADNILARAQETEREMMQGFRKLRLKKLQLVAPTPVSNSSATPVRNDGSGPSSASNGCAANKFTSPPFTLANGQNISKIAEVAEHVNTTLKELEKYKLANLKATNEKAEALENEKKKSVPGPKRFDRRRVPKQIKDQVKSLPIYESRDLFITTVIDNQIVIVVGATGSGKSTQIPQYLVDAGFADTGKIGCTQPRRVAAKSLAERVSLECGVTLGTQVGYAVRFDKCVSGETIIKYMTDGMLVNEIGTEPKLESYSVIVIDEAHERSINTDVLFGLLKKAVRERPELKVIVTSATLESEKFAKYFNNAPVINVRGKSYPVEPVYDPRNETTYIQGVVDSIFKIHQREQPGDVLVFLTGQDEIDQVWELVEIGMSKRRILTHEILLLPCCGSLPLEEQQKIFEETPKGCRKVILATNIAETSLTVDGIVYVVDCGYFKQNEYNPKTGISALVKHRVTEAQAIQRQGRAGRTKPGKVYRLYSQYEFARLPKSGVPEIKRSNVESVVLDLIGMGVSDILKFDFMDPPTRESIFEALEHLQELSALDSHMGLTHLGRRMSQFPLDPPLAKALITSAELGCSREVLIIVALLSTQHQNIFYRNRKQRSVVDAMKALFNKPEGDHLTLLEIYKRWSLNDFSKEWCKDHYIQHRHLAEAEEIRIQLEDIMVHHKLPILTCGVAQTKIRKAFAAGFFRRLAKRHIVGHSFQTFALNNIADRDSVFLHPSSCLFHQKPAPEWVIYHEVVKTTKAYMRGTFVVEPQWLKDYAPEFVKKVARVYPGISLG